ncbi:hypothetical protein, conserved [Eimeria maxima]|uniref:Uncharacterized protein n=1 Tax=Eimeria maxima TaxID=5804 RepID=U6MAB8_EIMMA|nr:hypothetical protein, conserved [Eimeria maxima]CDJ61147.1 hypothetical protein, conserved [Eimeria maxima]
MSLSVQMQIRRNAEELRAYLADLQDWEGSFAEREQPHNPTEIEQEQRKAQPAEDDKRQEPLLQQQSQDKQQQQLTSPQQEGGHVSAGASQLQVSPSAETDRRKFARDLNTLSDYYKAWDSFDADADTEKEEDTIQRRNRALAKKKTFHPAARGNQPSRRSTKMCILGALPGAEIEELEGLQRIKTEANEAFRGGRLDDALIGYTRGIQEAEIHLHNRTTAAAVAETDTKSTGAAAAGVAEGAFEQLVGQLYGNRAAVFFQQHKYKECVKDCTIALQWAPLNPKILHRRGLAWSAQKETDKAIVDLRRALRLLQQQHQQEQQQQLAQQYKQQPEQQQTQQEQQDQEPEKQQQQQVAGVVSCSLSAAASSRESLMTRIETEIERIEAKVAQQMQEEQQRRKSALLMPLYENSSRFPSEPLRPLTVVAAAARCNRQALV